MPDWKRNRKVVLGITGGISAYKAPEIVRALVKSGCDVEVVLTSDGEKFVSPMVLSTLAGKRVWRQSDFLSDDTGWKIPHITLADWADVIIVAPCTAETLSNMARGAGKELLCSLLLAAGSPVVVFPAMNVNMFNHPATARNIEILKETGIIIADPETGSLACGYEGKGRLPSVEVILEEMWKALCPSKKLEGKNVLVTAGPTREFLDPVRFLSNPSTGKMGYAMARSAWYRGASITFVHGPAVFSNLGGFDVKSVVSAEEMKRTVLSLSEEMDYIVKAAAVGDFRAASFSDRKIKRANVDTLTVDLVQNTDIAAALGERKRQGQILVGFAAESHDLLLNASEKMRRKNLDFIVANDITASGSGFGTETNTVKLLSVDGSAEEFSGTKEDVAESVWSRILEEDWLL
ncbi:bifunctional phosphopantothenoylcysteine decarboxylase/phosphopantothenate--cysteine ligase CoaBC [Aminivibrio sp.]|jgi:phosphopantothenoylcysteine decarboxylase/phosphopantothenate--cysteine ligase|uniref:bifunctional phosphopantothenoylcysteine decarboxylase/phosphopantothenate--cysteine ligase CoaBC n=1 Tax=Aminivibrio sp. TaxID=1872489 RepID=UPI001A4B5CC3|nr:bifunctional phosphopantothenoylcysteine decarboxylase/phosphopantothenate--cysteine ligase CoaBC [Aminivibrio sp.]MBL3538580.1 bifunctional phosphopantothenoylcysteine decarboxylase/phosphopantothenate--cysteine ligase CoaBC [Aminivibrio sp.]